MMDLVRVTALTVLLSAGVTSGLPRLFSGKNSAARSQYMIHCSQPDNRPERQFRIIYALDIQKYSTKLHPGTEISFQCHNGYRLTGNSMLRCGQDGKWDQPKMPTCEKISRQAACGPPPVILHGGYKYDDTNPLLARFYCIQGYKNTDAGATTMECTDGQWTGKTPECFKSAVCPDLGPIENGRWSCSSSDCMNRQAGSVISVVCNNGFERHGAYSLSCEDSGEWSQPKPSCASKTCPELGQVANGRYECITKNCLDNKIGAIVKVTCADGYGLKDNYMYSLTCRNNGAWSAEKPECVEMKGCQSPVNIHHGQWTLYGQFTMVKYDMFGVGTTVFYRCDSGYKLVGRTEQVMCLSSGVWSGFPPTCEPEFSCKDPGPVKNGRYELTTASCLTYMGMGSKCLQYDVGSKLVFMCDEGYERDGSYELECDNTGTWTAEKPKCVKAPTSLPQGNDLESTTNTMTIVIITSCSVLGILLITMIIVAFQRRNKPQPRILHQVQAPPPYSNSRNSCATVEEHDRVALIAYADGHNATLPSYDEAVRGPRTPGRAHRQHPSLVPGYRPLPSLPPSMRRQGSDATSTASGSQSARDPDGISRHSTITVSTVNRDALSENFGSLDTMNTMNISDGTSTSVTVDTYDSAASMPSISASRRATAGSVESNGSLGFANEDCPLLVQSNNSSRESMLITDVTEETKNE